MTKSEGEKVNKFSKLGLALCATVALGLGTKMLLAAGMITNGLPTVCAPLQNGANATLVPATGANGTGATSPSLNCSQTQASGSWLTNMDTGLAGGSPPQSVAETAFQVASVASEVASQTATSTVHAATLNTRAGTITTEALATAAGATYTFTLTNSLITATGPTPAVQIHSGTNTGGSLVNPLTLNSVTNAAGSTVLVFTNNGTTALNGTMILTFYLGD